MDEGCTLDGEIVMGLAACWRLPPGNDKRERLMPLLISEIAFLHEARPANDIARLALVAKAVERPSWGAQLVRYADARG